MPTTKSTYNAPSYGETQSLATKAGRQKSLGMTLGNETADAAKFNARNEAYKAWKASKSSLGDVADSVATQVERRNPVTRMSDEAFRTWQSTPRPGGATRTAGAVDDIFASFHKGMQADAAERFAAERFATTPKVNPGALESLFSAGSKVANTIGKIPGARFAGQAMGKLAVPLMLGQGAYDLGRMGYEGGKAALAAQEANLERMGSEAKYGTIGRATTTRNSNLGFRNDWSEPSNYVERSSAGSSFGSEPSNYVETRSSPSLSYEPTPKTYVEKSSAGNSGNLFNMGW